MEDDREAAGLGNVMAVVVEYTFLDRREEVVGPTVGHHDISHLADLSVAEALLQVGQELLRDAFRIVAKVVRIAQSELLSLAEIGVLEVQDPGDPGVGETCLLTLSSSRDLSLLAVGEHRRTHADHLLDLWVELAVLPDRLDQSEKRVPNFVGQLSVIDLGYELHE
jgi:hypothetical protein